jgi:hypothetical protein
LYYICQNDDLGIHAGPIHRDAGSTTQYGRLLHELHNRASLRTYHIHNNYNMTDPVLHYVAQSCLNDARRTKKSKTTLCPQLIFTCAMHTGDTKTMPFSGPTKSDHLLDVSFKHQVWMVRLKAKSQHDAPIREPSSLVQM